jgi:xanthine dehydrogenase molybdopterin-binding subunit B
VNVSGQKHFYMEVQNAVARFLEDDTLDIVASTQAPGISQGIASAITGLPAHRINVANRRSGGAFGGKVCVCLCVHGPRRSWMACCCDSFEDTGPRV